MGGVCKGRGGRDTIPPCQKSFKKVKEWWNGFSTITLEMASISRVSIFFLKKDIRWAFKIFGGWGLVPQTLVALTHVY